MAKGNINVVIKVDIDTTNLRKALQAFVETLEPTTTHECDNKGPLGACSHCGEL